MSLYQRHRPQKFEDVVGQGKTITTLENQFKEGKFSQAYLFYGPRGTGKTTTARLVAKALNCDNPKDGFPCGKCETCLAIATGRYLDVIEIDAASNRGIEEIRDLREKIKLSPTGGKYKVYIIDEVHMLTNEAFNALLKTLEEPPNHAVFILCTTDHRKVPPTVISRCQRFEFNTASNEDLVSILHDVAKKESIKISDEVARLIANTAEGSFRDALTLLEQAGSSGEVTVAKLPNLVNRDSSKKFLEIIESENTVASFQFIGELENSGVNIISFTADLIRLMREELILAVKSENNVRQVKLVKLIHIFSDAHLRLKNAFLPGLPLELAVIDAVGAKEEIVKEVVAEITRETSVTTSDEITTKDPIVTADLESLKKSWEQLLKAIKPFNHSLEAFLRGSEPYEFSDKYITLRFFYKFHKDMVDQPKNRQLVETELGRLLGKDIRIKTVLGEKPVAKKLSYEEIHNLEEVPTEDLAEKAVNIFNSGLS